MKYHKGRFVPKNIYKYKGDHSRIYHRSGLEKRFMILFDKNPAVLEWASEEIVIPYYSTVDRKRHRYYPDFYAKLQTKNGIKQYVFEIKPKSLFEKRKTPKRITKKFLREMAEIEINNNKWKAAKAFCEKLGWSFEVLTDNSLKRFRS
tara:strand:- start:1842 stop:2285 length:444 start_codon:yes stop_codon:yes gene_type:complete